MSLEGPYCAGCQVPDGRAHHCTGCDCACEPLKTMYGLHPNDRFDGGFEEATRLDAEARVRADQAPDSNAQLWQPRTCTACQHTSVPRPWTPGWTPDRERGWICPDCSRKMSA